MKEYNFFEVVQKIQENTIILKLSQDSWQAIQRKINYYLTEKGDFTNIHKLWLASLASIQKQIFDKSKKSKKNFSIKLKAYQFFAIKELILDMPVNDPFYLATVVDIITQIDKQAV